MQLSPASSKLHPFTFYSSSSAELQLQEIVQGDGNSQREEREVLYLEFPWKSLQNFCSIYTSEALGLFG